MQSGITSFGVLLVLAVLFSDPSCQKCYANTAVSRENSQSDQQADIDQEPETENGVATPANIENPTSRSLIEVIFSSPLGIAGVVILFFVVFAIVYVALRHHQSAAGG